MEHKSTYTLLGLPDDFATVLLIVALILALSPYLSGADFGVFKVPSFSDEVRSRLRLLGPLALAGVVLLFLPVWPPSDPAASEVSEDPDTFSIAPEAPDPVPAEAPARWVVVHGTVRNAQGAPLPGGYVTASGSNTGVVTDSDGSYRIQVPIYASGAIPPRVKFQAIGTQVENVALPHSEMEEMRVDVVLRYAPVTLDSPIPSVGRPGRASAP